MLGYHQDSIAVIYYIERVLRLRSYTRAERNVQEPYVQLQGDVPEMTCTSHFEITAEAEETLRERFDLMKFPTGPGGRSLENVISRVPDVMYDAENVSAEDQYVDYSGCGEGNSDDCALRGLADLEEMEM